MFIPWATATCIHQKQLLCTTSWKNSSSYCEKTLFTQQTRTRLPSLWKHFGCGGPPQKNKAQRALVVGETPTAEFKW